MLWTLKKDKSDSLKLLLLIMPPVYAPSGYTFGIPTWTVLAIAISLMTSGFVAYSVFQVWTDPEEIEVKNIVEWNKINNIEAIANPKILKEYKNLDELKS